MMIVLFFYSTLLFEKGWLGPEFCQSLTDKCANAKHIIELSMGISGGTSVFIA